jgi:hypothetical protein
MAESIFNNSFEIKIYDDILEKYSNDKCFSIQEIKKDCENIKPSNIPILDICFAQLMGKYIHNNMIQQQWSESQFIISDLYHEISNIFPEICITMYDFKMYILEYRKKNKSPELIDLIILEFMTPYLKNFYQIDNKQSSNLEAYLNARCIIIQKSKNLMSQYFLEWNNIKVMFNEIKEMIAEKFEVIEDDPNYIIAFEMLEDIKEKANEKISKLIDETVQFVIQKFNMFKYEIDKIDKIKNEITDNFTKTMDEIYHDVILSKNLNNLNYNMISNLFDVEKAQNRCCLEMEFGLLMLKYYNISCHDSSDL